MDTSATDDFFGGCFAFYLPTMVRIFNEVFARYNVETADGRLDAFTGKPTKDKFEMSFDRCACEYPAPANARGVFRWYCANTTPAPTRA